MDTEQNATTTVQNVEPVTVLVPALTPEQAQAMKEKLKKKDYGTHNLDLAYKVVDAWLQGRELPQDYLDTTYFPGTNILLRQILQYQNLSIEMKNECENALRFPLMQIFTIKDSLERHTLDTPPFESYGAVWLNYNLSTTIQPDLT